MFENGQQETYRNRKKHNESEDFFTLDAPRANAFGSNLFGEGSYYHHHGSKRHPEKSQRNPEYPQCGTRASAQLPTALAQFEAMIATDREVSQQLQCEIDDLGREVKQMWDANSQLERQLQQEFHEQRRLVTQMQELESQRENARQRLIECHMKKRSMDLNSFALNEDKTSMLDQQRREVLQEVLEEREAMRLERRRSA